MSLIILPSRALLRADRPILSPGWDDMPADRPRKGRAAWWRLLSGRAGVTQFQPGACCGCTAVCSSCVPHTNLNLSWTTSGGCASNAGPFTMTFSSVTGDWTYTGGPVGACGTINSRLYCSGTAVGFHFCDDVPALGQQCCDSVTNSGILVRTSMTCGSSFVATFAFDATVIAGLPHGNSCYLLYTSNGYRTFTVSS